jgi:hypothetical protein
LSTNQSTTIDMPPQESAPTEANPNPGQNDGVERPAWLPEKFQSPEDMAKAYGELETRLGQSNQTPPPTDPNAPKPNLDIPNEQKQTAEQTQALQKFTDEFSQNGTLADESYEELAKLGYDRQIVDTYIAGQQAIASQIRSNITSAAGGEEGYESMVKWAAANLSDGEKQAYNAVVNSGDAAQAQLAVQGLHARYQNANGTDPTLLGGSTPATSNPYSSWAEITRDMNSPEYAVSPDFRAEVERRIAASKNI